MFTYTDETRTIWFNPHSLESALEFELIGILLGVAIYNSIILDVRFPLTVYKKVKDMTHTLDDLSEAQPTIARSLKAMRDYEGDVESTFCATFQVRCRVLFARHRSLSLSLAMGRRAQDIVRGFWRAQVSRAQAARRAHSSDERQRRRVHRFVCRVAAERISR